jgi:hypothetical protein
LEFPAETPGNQKCRAKAMAIVELKQPNYNATIEAIAQAVLASLRPGAATDKLLAVGAEMSTKLTTHIEDFERLANDVLLAVWDRLEAATSGQDAACLVNLTLEDVRQVVAAMLKSAIPWREPDLLPGSRDRIS